MKKLLFITILLAAVFTAKAEDGSRLWLRYEPMDDYAERLAPFANYSSDEPSQTMHFALQELAEAFEGFSGGQPINPTGNLILGTYKGKKIRSLLRPSERPETGRDGFIIRTVTSGSQRSTVIASESEFGVLYGVFHLLRLIRNGNLPEQLNIIETPKYDVRILNHWDNLDRTIERGYAGWSLWKWDDLPKTINTRYIEYARANASIGINATVLNNVNANPDILTTEYLEKVTVLAEVFRPWGLKVYLSVNFASPERIGGLTTSDPLDKSVKLWWKKKADEIYKLIPDFGGFLVKANSEGQSGPQDYGRTHVDGANMMAEALAPHGGIVMWRAFVYDPTEEDRAKQAYSEFVPLDGMFRDNVILQVKNGPIDFQPREPFSPLFGAMRETPVMVEFQITQEYLGFSNHLAYLATMFKEVLDSDTYSDGPGSTVARVTDGSLREIPVTAIAGVSNIGEDANWNGHIFAQANWYCFGRLAWDHSLTPEKMADEWLRMTFTDEPEFLSEVSDMMLTSRETVVDYMMPLGLHHIFALSHHYGPEPWCNPPGLRPDWLPPYYHRADAEGLGFDRTVTGSNAVSQYFPPLNGIYNDINQCPENLLLWFHHVPWDHRMHNGRTMWDELCYRYDAGVQQVREYQKVWDRMEKYVDKGRFEHVQSKLRIQSRDAVWWKDACLLYFQTFSERPIPYDIERPVHELEDLMKIKLDMTHHN